MSRLELGSRIHDALERQIAFEASLQVGSPVRVYWGSSGVPCECTGKIAKVNEKSFQVAIDHEVVAKGWEGRVYPYAAGHKILVPRVCARNHWSLGNRVGPVGGGAP